MLIVGVSSSPAIAGGGVGGGRITARVVRRRGGGDVPARSSIAPGGFSSLIITSIEVPLDDHTHHARVSRWRQRADLAKS